MSSAIIHEIVAGKLSRVPEGYKFQLLLQFLTPLLQAPQIKCLVIM